jgi:hypothetical protein
MSGWWWLLPLWPLCGLLSVYLLGIFDRRVWPSQGDGRAAGPRRNQRMLEDFRPDLVVAFPGGRGTAYMVRRAGLAWCRRSPRRCAGSTRAAGARRVGMTGSRSTSQDGAAHAVGSGDEGAYHDDD